MNCTQCTREMHGSATHPVCITCRSSRTCTGCGKKLSTERPGRKRSGLCITCLNGRPWSETRRAKVAASTAARHAERLTDPQKRAALVASGKRLAKLYPPTPEKVQAQISSRAASHWCPAEYAEMNRDLKRRKFSTDERKRIILGHVAEHERRAEAALTPFKRQLARVAAGARLVEKPVIRRAGYEGTLGGVVGEML